jgi:hypothetical protein
MIMRMTIIVTTIIINIQGQFALSKDENSLKNVSFDSKSVKILRFRFSTLLKFHRSRRCEKCEIRERVL